MLSMRVGFFFWVGEGGLSPPPVPLSLSAPALTIHQPSQMNRQAQ